MVDQSGRSNTPEEQERQRQQMAEEQERERQQMLQNFIRDLEGQGMPQREATQRAQERIEEIDRNRAAARRGSQGS